MYILNSEAGSKTARVSLGVVEAIKDCPGEKMSHPLVYRRMVISVAKVFLSKIERGSKGTSKAMFIVLKEKLGHHPSDWNMLPSRNGRVSSEVYRMAPVTGSRPKGLNPVFTTLSSVGIWVITENSGRGQPSKL